MEAFITDFHSSFPGNFEVFILGGQLGIGLSFQAFQRFSSKFQIPWDHKS